MKDLEITESEKLAELDLRIAYIKMECTKCGNTWGITIYNSTIPTRGLVCEVCAGNKILEEISK